MAELTYNDLPPKLVPTPHPVYPRPSPEEIKTFIERDGGKAYAEWFNKREQLIALADRDPLKYGHEMEMWGDARRLLAEGNDVCVLGGNRSSKSEFGAKRLTETCRDVDAAAVWAWQEDERASIERQQPYVRRHLPPEWRDVGKRGRVTNVSYTVKNGFSQGIFVLPNRSQCTFMTYRAYKQDTNIVEGAELDFIWLDELAPPDLAETLRYRTVTRHGKILLTFTAIEGYSMTVKQYLEGARIRETRPAPLLPQNEVLVPGCPRGHMPYILECTKRGRYVICFFTEWNPFNPYDKLAALIEGESREKVMVRAYGWPTKQIAGAFPKFGEPNILPPDKIPEKGTNYVAIDPGGAKNWFLIWLRVDANGFIYVYREWPDIAIGDWAEPSEKFDGKAGPAQRIESGRGVRGYKILMLEAEGWTFDEAGWHGEQAEHVMERIIDPRAGNAQVPGIEDGTSLIELAEQEQVDRNGRVLAPAMIMAPAPGARIQEGIELIQEALEYNQETPLTMENCPRLYVSSACKNLIYALRTYTGADGEKGATKDPIDCLKYAFKRELIHVEDTMLEVTGGGSY